MGKQKTIEAAALGDGAVIEHDVAGHLIALYRVNDEYFATDAICTHGQANLADGELNGYEIACPFHYGMFDIRDGSPTVLPCVVPLKTHPVDVGDDGCLYVTLRS